MLKMLKNKVFVGVFVMALAVVGFSANKAQATGCSAANSTDWATPSTWGAGCTGPSGIPSSSDDVVIPGNKIVTVTAAGAVAGTVSISDPIATGSNGITISSPGTLAVTGAVTFVGSSGASNSTIAVADGSLTAAGITITGGASGNSVLNATTGTIGSTSGIALSGGAKSQLTTTGAAHINLTGALSTGGTLAINVATTLTTTGTSSINGAYTLGNLTVSTGTTTTGAAVTVAGNTSVASGAFLTMGNFAFTATGTTGITGTINTATGLTGTRTFTGLVTINSGGVWDLSGQNPATSFGAGGITNNGTTFNNGSGAAAFSASTALAGTSNMTFGGSVTPAGGQTVTNNNTGTVTITGTLALTGNWTQGTNSNLTLGSTTATSGAGVFTAAATGNTVNYAGAAQTVQLPATTYYNLTLSGTGVKTFAATGFNIGNNLVISSGLSPVLLTTGFASTLSGGLQIYGSWKAAVSWGSSTSAAVVKNDVYFASGSNGIVTPTVSHSGGASSITCSSGATLVNGVCKLTSSTSTTTSGGGTTTTTTPAVNAVLCPTGAMFNTVSGQKCNTFVSSITCPTGAMFDTLSGQKCTLWSANAPTITILPPVTPFNETIASAMGTGVVKLGSKGNACKVWQMFFNGHGAKLTVDGNCGKLTIAFAKTWQASAGLKADGMLGPMSRAKANVQ
jgi:hypothetical protein